MPDSPRRAASAAGDDRGRYYRENDPPAPQHAKHLSWSPSRGGGSHAQPAQQTPAFHRRAEYDPEPYGSRTFAPAAPAGIPSPSPPSSYGGHDERGTRAEHHPAAAPRNAPHPWGVPSPGGLHRFEYSPDVIAGGSGQKRPREEAPGVDERGAAFSASPRSRLGRDETPVAAAPPPDVAGARADAAEAAPPGVGALRASVGSLGVPLSARTDASSGTVFRAGYAEATPSAAAGFSAPRIVARTLYNSPVPPGTQRERAPTDDRWGSGDVFDRPPRAASPPRESTPAPGNALGQARRAPPRSPGGGFDPSGALGACADGRDAPARGTGGEGALEDWRPLEPSRDAIGGDGPEGERRGHRGRGRDGGDGGDAPRAAAAADHEARRAPRPPSHPSPPRSLHPPGRHHPSEVSPASARPAPRVHPPTQRCATPRSPPPPPSPPAISLRRPRLVVECRLRADAEVADEEATRELLRHLRSLSSVALTPGPLVPPTDAESPALRGVVESLEVAEVAGAPDRAGGLALAWDVDWETFVYRFEGGDAPCRGGLGVDAGESGDSDDGDACGEGDDEDAPFSEWELPAKALHPLWSSLCYEDDLPARLARYVASVLAFSSLRIDPSLVCANRVLLLHGPPGTGKTSLCRALAQRAAVRHRRAYPRASLLEVHAHALFSRWFGESGRQVCRLFDAIEDAAADPGRLVFVLLDEAESLAAARGGGGGGGGDGGAGGDGGSGSGSGPAGASSSSEPADATRAVNALLTRLDGLRGRRNVVLMATSNLPGTIDLAFLDRADVQAYVGPPGRRARYRILASCLGELERAGLLGELPCPLWDHLAGAEAVAAGPAGDEVRVARALCTAVEASEGLSGRALRKLPLLAHAAREWEAPPICPREFATAIGTAAERERRDRRAAGSVHCR